MMMLTALFAFGVWFTGSVIVAFGIGAIMKVCNGVQR